MNIVYTVIGFLMLADALFAWANIDRVKPAIHRVFPKLNFKLFIWIEGVAGTGIIAGQLMFGQ